MVSNMCPRVVITAVYHGGKSSPVSCSQGGSRSENIRQTLKRKGKQTTALACGAAPPLIPAFVRQRLADLYEAEACLVYIVSSRLHSENHASQTRK